MTADAPATRIIPVEWDDPRSVAIRDAFDAEMSERYSGFESSSTEDDGGTDDVFATNLDDLVVAMLLVNERDEAVGHASLFRRPEAATLELRKLAISPAHRRRGYARTLLREVEDVAKRLGAERIVLDTGPMQPDAIALYEAMGYRRIPPFPPYDRLGEDGAICFEVPLR